MADAKELVDKIFLLVNLQMICAAELNEMAADLEERRKAVNQKQVFGSSMSVLGATALTVAGACTGGAAVAPLLLAAKVGSLVGLGTNVGSEVEDAVKSNTAMKDAEKISQKIKNLEEEVQNLMESLAEKRERDGGCSDLPPEYYVLEQILREMAKCKGLELNGHISVQQAVSYCLKMEISLDKGLGLARCSRSGFMLLNLIVNILKVATSTGQKASAKALKYVTGGALGLVFSVPELIYNCVNLSNCETTSSKSLREMAKAMSTAAENMKHELDTIELLFRMMSEVKRIIESRNRSLEEKQKLIEFAINQCQDEEVKQWLKENSESVAFFELVDMFNFLQEELCKKKIKTDCKDINIIFVAHGAIEGSMFPASCLLPLPTIKDVLLYSPWNCTISADVAYGIATGRMQPEDRVFSCGEKDCKIPDGKHQPTKLPNGWNSMRKAEGQKIPNIIVSTLTKPEDSAWKRFEYLNDECGQPEKNRIVIPFILPRGIGSSLKVPFSVITLALSLVLFFSSYRATVHLAACLSRREGTPLSEDDLKAQYACTIENTLMTPSKRMWLNRDGYLYRVFKALFG